jgi:hypothetical protein
VTPPPSFSRSGEVLDDGLDLRGGEDVGVGEAGEDDVLGAELEEDAVELVVVVDVLLTFLALDLVERRLGDVDVAALDEALHLAVEEREQEGADVGAVHVGVGHDDDLVVAGLGGVEGADVALALPMPVPMAVMRVRISSLARTLSRRAFSVLMSLPRRGRMAWKRRSRPCLAEPPAESPSTM